MRVFSVLLIFISFSVKGQQSSDIEVLHKVTSDSIILRWSPTSVPDWTKGLKVGYLLSRYRVVKDDTMQFIIDKKFKIKPLPLDDWEPLVKKDKYAAIAAQAIYGDDFEVNMGEDASGMAIYNQVTEYENRFGFSLYAADMSFEAAKAMGLGYVDEDFDSSQKYVYRLALEGENPITGITFLDADSITTLPPVNGLSVQFKDKVAELSWTTLYDYGIYSAYIIERSDDGGITYKPRVQVPFQAIKNNLTRKTSFVDSLEANYKLYIYRVRGKDPFGATGPASEGVKGAGKGSAKGVIAYFDSTYIDNKGYANLLWTFPDDLKRNILGYYIARGNNAKGPFMSISGLLPPEVSSFIDRNVLPVNYYVVKVLGKDSLVTTSLPALIQPLDSLPPAIPSNLTGSIDTTGLVELNWKPSPEEDVAGYRVFRSNTRNGEYVQVTSEPLRFSAYSEKIQIKTLTQKVYYKVTSVDIRDNQSKYSTPLELDRPDIVAPAAPSFQFYRSSEEGIYLEWVHGPGDDTEGQILHRLSITDTLKSLLQPHITTYLDQEVKAGQDYTYRLIALDKSGNKSTSAEIVVQAYKKGKVDAKPKVVAEVDREKRHIKIQWSFRVQEVKQYDIYRKKNDGSWHYLTSVSGDEQQTIDDRLYVNNIYAYTVKAILEGEEESEFSELVSVKY